jgi:hypothetical protein
MKAPGRATRRMDPSMTDAHYGHLEILLEITERRYNRGWDSSAWVRIG